MLKIFEINSVSYGSTGNIARSISNEISKVGKSIFAFGRTNSNIRSKQEYIIGTDFEKSIHSKLGIITGLEGSFSYFSTKRLIKKINLCKPDIVHIHNLHSWYINYNLLFKYLSKNKIKTVWTLHDCWAFTGHCPHFESVNCFKWKSECHNCPLYKKYPQSFIDNSRFMYNRKKKIFTKIDHDNLTIVTPSKWLENYVRQSYLNKYDVHTINNGIDLNIYKPTENNFREKHNLEGKIILLGVSFVWNDLKGLDVFIKLSKDLDLNYQIVLVGTNDEIDEILPKNIISIHKTENKEELAQIYTASDIFINPTKEDNFPTVNIESLACGTPVITFDTGGCSEIVTKECGRVVKKNDYEDLALKIKELSKNKINSKKCIDRAKKFSSVDKYLEYIELFKKIVGETK